MLTEWYTNARHSERRSPEYHVNSPENGCFRAAEAVKNPFFGYVSNRHNISRRFLEDFIDREGKMGLRKTFFETLRERGPCRASPTSVDN